MDHDSAVDELTGRDPELAAVVTRFGRPTPFRRPAGFATLVLMILEQQVSLASAAAAFRRLEAMTDVTPEGIARLSDHDLREAGFSRQKTRYVRGLGDAVTEGRLRFEEMGGRTDAEVRSTLTALTGIGAWTADVYLLAVLDRPDVWPVTDRALQVGTAEVIGLPQPPGPAELMEIGERWRPLRSTAARLVWHAYLGSRGRSAPPV